MSDYGEEIIGRLPPSSALHNPNNDARKVIDRTIGEWLDHYSITDFFENMFLQSATGKWLDLHGNDYGVPRKLDESDDDYRERIVYETLGELTINFLVDVYNVELYTFVDNFDASDNTLVSDNQYISQNGFLIKASDDVRAILSKKFVLGSDVTWL